MDSQLSPLIPPPASTDKKFFKSKKNMYIFAASIIVLLVILAYGLLVISFRRHKGAQIIQIPVNTLPTITPTPISTSWKTFTNSKYKLSFNYPSEYTINVDNDLTVWLIDKERQYTLMLNFNSADNCGGSKYKEFLDYAVQEGICNYFAGNAEEASTNKVAESVIKNPYGLSGYKIYFHLTNQNTIDGKIRVDEATVGPVLAFDVSNQTKNLLREVEIRIFTQDFKTPIDPKVITTVEKIGDSLHFIDAIQSSPTDITTWKIFTESKYGQGYSFKYPSTWKIRLDDINKYVFIESPDYNSAIGKGKAIYISRVKVDTTTTVEQSAKQMLKGSINASFNNLHYLTLNGNTVLQYDMAAAGSGSTIMTFIKNGYQYYIGFNQEAYDDDIKKYLPILTQVVQSFQAP